MILEQATALTEWGEWIRTGGTAAIVAMLLGFWLKKRKDDREGWGALIEALTKDVNHVRQQHADCEKRLTDVEAQLRGVHRQLVLHSATTGIALGQPSVDVTRAAERVKKIVEKGLEDEL